MVIFALEFRWNFGYRDLFYYFVRFFVKKKLQAQKKIRQEQDLHDLQEKIREEQDLHD